MADPVALIGVDSAGGLISLSFQDSLTLDGVPIVVVGAGIDSHGSGAHSGAQMDEGSATVTLDGIGLCVAGDLATCGHAASGSGSSFTITEA